MTKRRIGLFIIAALVCFSVFSVSKSVMESAKQGGEAKETGSLGEYWAEGSEPAADLSGYIAAVTDEASADYIPPEDRIAVFDLDGTLMCETYPFCFEFLYVDLVEMTVRLPYRGGSSRNQRTRFQTRDEID